MSGSDRPVYSIGAVATMLGVPTATLRTWEERYGVVVPERSAGGRRLYTRDQVDQLKFLLDQLAAGLSPADAHRLLGGQLTAGVDFPSVRHAGGNRLLILLVERNLYAAEFAEYFLRTEGYDVALVTGADEALERAAEASPDIAVVDLLVSGARGLALCTRLRERTQTPVLAISTLAQRDEALEAGASVFLQKPVDPLQMVSAIQDLLGRSAFLRRETKVSRTTEAPRETGA